MKMTPDDPRLTAYALGELDPAERAVLEVELKNAPECREIVDQIRATAAQLSTEFAAEELPALSFARETKIRNELQPSRSRASFWPRLLFYGSAAAVVAVFFAVLISRSSPPMAKSQRTLQMAQANNTPATGHSPDPEFIGVLDTASIASTQPAPPSSDRLAQNFGAGYGSALNAPPANNPVDSKTAPGKEVSSAALNRYEFKTDLNSSAPPETGAKSQFVPQPLAPTLQSKAETQVLTKNGTRGGATPADALSMLRTEARFGDGLTASTPSSAGAYDANSRSTHPEVQLRDALSDLEQMKESERLDLAFRRSTVRAPNTATYPKLVENAFQPVRQNPLSTFSIDVDTASYANIRRFLTANQLPPRDAIRIEEMINYFPYRYPQPRGTDPFSANIEVAGCPWNSEHRLVRIGLKGRDIARNKRPASNFVFLIDVSGSMQPAERLPLLKQALRQLVKKMTATDRVAIVVYASEAGVKLVSTSCAEKETILAVIDSLTAGGSTNGGDGIQQAYRVAQENFITGGVNRVLLCTDGDFNVGMTDQNELVRMIQEKAKSGVFLTTLGVGTDNYKDALMQKLADKGNGNYSYLDTPEEAQKVLIEQMNGTLVTIAKDVKIQIEFNPARVGAYRLIGYEKRLLRKEDFNNDAKDAGEIGAGHTVTALYEIVPPGKDVSPLTDELKYQQPVAAPKPERYTSTDSSELLTLKLRYKQPDGDRSKLLEVPVTDSGTSYARATDDFKFASAVASFGMLLRDSEYKGSASYSTVLELAQEGKGSDELGYRSEFINLVKKARSLSRQ